MTTYNICRSNTDPFYRYKMPGLQSKTEGRGNGIKTAVLNMSDVARALSRPPSYVIKFFGFELGAQTKMEEANDRYLVNGQHDTERLQEILDTFINNFVLCPACKNPETDLEIDKKNGTITRNCKACGQRRPIDPRQKLTTYILKNAASSKSSKKSKKAAHASAQLGNGTTISDIAAAHETPEDLASADASGDAEDAADDDDDELTRRINAEAAQLSVTEVDVDNWDVDTSEEAVAARARELEALKIVEKAVDEEDGESPYAVFGDWIVSFGEDKGKLPSDVEIYKKAKSLDIVDSIHTVHVLAQTLFDDGIVDEVEAHSGLLTKLITSKEHEKAFMGGLERFIGLEKPELKKQVPRLLIELYNEEIVSEDVLRNWASKVSKKYVPKDVSKSVRLAAKPFIQWLDNAEEESEEESSDEE